MRCRQEMDVVLCACRRRLHGLLAGHEGCRVDHGAELLRGLTGGGARQRHAGAGCAAVSAQACKCGVAYAR